MTIRSASPPVGLLVAAGVALLFFAYWLIFVFTTDEGVAGSAVAALNNTVPAIGLAWLTHLILHRYVWPGPYWIRLTAHLPLSILFALAWYLAILVARDFRGDWLTQGFSVRPFVPVAFAWQMFQGITFYALTALASLAILLGQRREAVAMNADPAIKATPCTLLVRTADGTEAVAVDEIATISGAGDYSELSLRNRKILSTTTLAEFEARLPEEQFFRAHRSHIVRVAAIVRSEPAGNGRTVLHIGDGSTVTTSRAGTRALREAAL